MAKLPSKPNTQPDQTPNPTPTPNTEENKSMSTPTETNTQDAGQVTEETVETGIASPDNVAAGVVSDETKGEAPTPAAPTQNGEKVSAYKQRLQEKNRDAVGAEIPLELADMMRAAAKQQGDIALTSWIRLAWADAVNAANLTKKDDDGNDVPWKFDKATLETSAARTSTGGRALTDEEKAAKAAKQKEEQKSQRDLIKQLLAEHKAKIAAATAGNASNASNAKS